jgi:hypothetical protein
MAEDYAKEPPVMPPHLQLTLLNVPSTAESTTSLPRPQHVILNHIYVQRGQVGYSGFGWWLCSKCWPMLVGLGIGGSCVEAESQLGEVAVNAGRDVFSQGFETAAG